MTDLRKSLKEWLVCTRCQLHKTRRQVVLGRGVAPAGVLFIGEAPGRSEDLRGEAFVGRAGRILDAAILDATRHAGLESAPSYYITNVVGCIPVDVKFGPFREPTRQEELACWRRLELTARLVDPEVVILLGKVAEAACLDAFEDAVCLQHPAYLLRRGGTTSTEYRTFVRELSDVFRKVGRPSGTLLGPKDVFGDNVR